MKRLMKLKMMTILSLLKMMLIMMKIRFKTNKLYQLSKQKMNKNRRLLLNRSFLMISLQTLQLLILLLIPRIVLITKAIMMKKSRRKLLLMMKLTHYQRKSYLIMKTNQIHLSLDWLLMNLI